MAVTLLYLGVSQSYLSHLKLFHNAAANYYQEVTPHNHIISFI